MRERRERQQERDFFVFQGVSLITYNLYLLDGSGPIRYLRAGEQVTLSIESHDPIV